MPYLYALLHKQDPRHQSASSLSHDLQDLPDTGANTDANTGAHNIAYNTGADNIAYKEIGAG